ncbi:unnamed protein product, partial [Cyprideis torosa]
LHTLTSIFSLPQEFGTCFAKMNTLCSRANALLAFTLSVLASLTFICFLSTFFEAYKANVDIKTFKATVKNVPDYSAAREYNDLGFITFDLKADLTSLFNWNVKQLFLYLTAEYETPNNKLNQVVLWDKIIQRGENPILDYHGLNTKYYFWDDGKGLKGNQNVTLTLSWNVVPNAGHLPNVFGVGSHRFQFPAEYHSKS